MAADWGLEWCSSARPRCELGDQPALCQASERKQEVGRRQDSHRCERADGGRRQQLPMTAHGQLAPPRCSGRPAFEPLFRRLGVTTEARHDVPLDRGSGKVTRWSHGAMGWKGRISSVPGRTTPAEDSGTSFQAPGRSPSGSETTNRVSSPKLCRISTSGCS